MVCAHLGDVHETLDTFPDLDKRTEGHQLGHPAVDQLTHLVGAGELLPWVLLGRLERQADPLPVKVDLEDLHLDLVTDRHHRRRMVNVLPRQLRNVDETVHAAEVDERTEVHHRGHDTLANLAGLEVGEEAFALFLLGLLEPCPT